jgi:hypothetical protein
MGLARIAPAKSDVLTRAQTKRFVLGTNSAACRSIGPLEATPESTEQVAGIEAALAASDESPTVAPAAALESGPLHVDTPMSYIADVDAASGGEERARVEEICRARPAIYYDVEHQ